MLGHRVQERREQELKHLLARKGDQGNSRTWKAGVALLLTLVSVSPAPTVHSLTPSRGVPATRAHSGGAAAGQRGFLSREGKGEPVML